MDSYRSSVIQSLLQLKAAYNWEQLGAKPDCELFCKPCETTPNAKASLYCATKCTHSVNEFGNNDQASDEIDGSPLVSRLTMKMGRSVNKRVIHDSDDEASVIAPLFHRVETSLDSCSAENSPILRVPASARSKTSRRIIADSESEGESFTDKPVQSKLYPAQSLQKSMLDEINLGDSSEAESDDNQDCDGAEDDDSWIVDDNSDTGGVANESQDYSNEESDAECDEQENVRPAKKNVVIDLSQSPDLPSKSPKKTLTKKVTGILSTTSSTPARGKSKTAQFTPGTAATPSKKLNRTELNQQRVEALSTGKKKFRCASADLALQLYQVYNEVIFDNQLPPDMSVTWNKRLLTTAGYCKCQKKYIDGEMQRSASIELSTKVVDSDERLRSTLIHEMCHAANWLIDLLDHAKHGKAFQQWGRRATKQFPEIAVTTCHSYTIHMPHKFKCTKAGCGVEYSRHTKKGLNPDKQRCGVCRSRIEYIGMASKDGVVAKPRQASGFSVYVKEHFAHTKRSLPSGTSTAEVMKVLAAQYKAEKAERAEDFGTAAGGLDVLRGNEAVDLNSDGGEGADDGSDGDAYDEENCAIDDVAEATESDADAAEGEQNDWLDQVEQQLIDLTI